MRPILFLLSLSSLILPVAGLAQGVPNDVELLAYGGATEILVTVELDIGGELPEEWVGWVIDRTKLGDCSDQIQLGPVRDFPDGSQSWVVADRDVLEGWTYKYRIWAVDAEGTRHTLPGYTLFPPVYYDIDYASIADEGCIAEGTIEEVDYFYGINIVPCPDNCWTEFAFVSDMPPELAALIGTGQVVRLFGDIEDNFEGPYAYPPYSWTTASSCSDPTGTEDTTWGALKVRFR